MVFFFALMRLRRGIVLRVAARQHVEQRCGVTFSMRAMAGGLSCEDAIGTTPARLINIAWVLSPPDLPTGEVMEPSVFGATAIAELAACTARRRTGPAGAAVQRA
jgi:hypothetical protein